MSRSYTYLLPPVIMLVLWWMGTLQHVWFFTTSIVFVISMFLYTRAIKRAQSLKEAERTKELLARIRHDQMNHVQVLMGYQMLKKADKISEYLNSLTGVANNEREISNITSNELAVYLLTLPHRYPQWQWKVQKTDTYIELPDKISSQMIQWLAACIKLLILTSKEQHNWQKISLQLSGNSEENIISICVYDTGENPVVLHVPAIEWTNLKNQLTHAHVKLDLIDQQQLMIRIRASR